jgi:glycosyltransferase involved in cell wall biosynthesis
VGGVKPARASIDAKSRRGERETIYLNGKFTAQHMTGTQRVASCLVREFDSMLAQSAHAPRVVLLCPPNGRPPELGHIEVRHTGSSGISLFGWEQLWLPLIARGRPLLNLGGTAPLFARNRACIFHDAAVFDCPQAYTLPFRVWYRLLFLLLSRRAGSVYTVSNFSSTQLTRHLGVRPGRIEVLSNGSGHLNDIVADADALPSFGLEPQRYWLAVGGASINKNLTLLRRAFERLDPKDGTKLVIVGGLNSQVFGDQPAAALAGDPRVVVTGPVSDATLKALYLTAKALVFPSLYEGCGLPPLEAMRCACPVLASTAASIPETCGDAALYFDPTSVDSLLEAMRRLEGDASLREELVQAGLARASKFNWRRSVQRIFERLTA